MPGGRVLEGGHCGCRRACEHGSFRVLRPTAQFLGCALQRSLHASPPTRETLGHPQAVILGARGPITPSQPLLKGPFG